MGGPKRRRPPPPCAMGNRPDDVQTSGSFGSVFSIQYSVFSIQCWIQKVARVFGNARRSKCPFLLRVLFSASRRASFLSESAEPGQKSRGGLYGWCCRKSDRPEGGARVMSWQSDRIFRVQRFSGFPSV